MTSNVSPTTQPAKTSEKSIPFYIPAEIREKTSDLKVIKAAFEACKNQEIGVQEAALLFGVHKRQLRSTLRHYDVNVIDEHYKVFVLTVFPAQAEIELSSYLEELIQSHVYMTNIDVRRLGYELLRKNYGVDYLPEERNCVLGQRWYMNLMTKFPQLDVGHSQFKAKIENLTNFYDSLENFVTSLGIDSTTIFCVDGVDLKIRTWSIKDRRNKHRSFFADCKAIVCTSPSGMFVPPIFLLPNGEDSTKCDIHDVESSEHEIEAVVEKKDDSDWIEILDDEETDPDFSIPAWKKIKVGSKVMSTRKTKRDTSSVSEDAASIEKTTAVTSTRKTKRKSSSVSEETADTQKQASVTSTKRSKRDTSSANSRKQITAHLTNKSQSKSGESIKELAEGLQEEQTEKVADCDAVSELKNKKGKEERRCEVVVNTVTPELFYSWFEKFLAFVRKTINKKLLLLVCDQSFVKHFRTLKLARENGVTFLVIPPRSVHKIYPMDGVARSLTRSIAAEATRWLVENRKVKTNQVPLYDFFKRAYKETTSPSIAKDAFLSSGLWPINRNIFSQTPESLQKDVQSVVGDTSP